eukprot:SAG31_NODE_988_length_10542_cov_52.848319_10_plen_66_part_00
MANVAHRLKFRNNPSSPRAIRLHDSINNPDIFARDNVTTDGHYDDIEHSQIISKCRSMRRYWTVV